MTEESMWNDWSSGWFHSSSVLFVEVSIGLGMEMDDMKRYRFLFLSISFDWNWNWREESFFLSLL